MSRPEQLQHAHRLLRKARSDLAAAHALAGDADQADDVVGFHVQQAVEKSVKAVMASLGLDYPRTHDIDYLVRQLTKHDVAVPDLLLEARWVSMWGVFTRYDDLDTVLDRAAAIEVATVAIEWADSTIQTAPDLQ